MEHPNRQVKSFTVEHVRAAAKMYVTGTPFKEIVKRLGFGKHVFQRMRRDFPKAWEKALSEEMEKLVVKVRADAGADAILADPEAHIALATRAEKWVERRGEALFPNNGEMTLSAFYSNHYLPEMLFEATEGTKRAYKTHLKKWVYLTGDPPVEKITNSMLATFRDALPKASGKHGLKASPNTVRSILGSIYTLLGKLGPPGPRNRDAIGTLKTIPWARPPRKDLKIPRTVAEEQIAACYEAAACMDKPKVPGIKPPLWWKLLLVLAWNTGLRHASIFSARLEYLDWKKQTLTLPSRCMKSKRPLVVHLNETIMEHFGRVRFSREMLLPCPWRRDQFYFWFNRLQQIAGIPEKDRFGLHTIRKTLATRLWEQSPAAAQYALGHTGMDVTRQHYVDGGPIVARALDALPQPAAFCQAR